MTELNRASDFNPLHVACRGGHFKVVKSLISKGAAVNLHDTEGNSPLYLACFSENAQTVRYLLKHGADINTRSPLNMMCQF